MHFILEKYKIERGIMWFETRIEGMKCMAKIFISYRDEDIIWRNTFTGLLNNPNAEFIDVPIEEREDYRETSEEIIKNYLRPLVGEADCLILLVGENTHNGKFLNWEIDVAISQQKPIGAIRIPETKGGLPSKLQGMDIQLVIWNRTRIQNMIDRLFGR